jgi:transposase
MNEAAWKHEIAKRDEIIFRQADALVAFANQVASLQQKVSELTSLLQEKAGAKDAKKPKFAEDYSLKRQERKKLRRRKKESTGRKPTQAKQHLVQRTENVYPHGVPSRRCELAREQCAWRLKDGRAVYVRYRIFRERDTETLPQVFGLRNTRCEFGLEIHVVLAFLVYQIGVSIDQAREILRFFTRLDMSKSQADSLLNQLAADWDADFDALCELVARAAVLYLDETGWKVGKRACYTWIFTTLSHVVFLCGKGRGGDVLDGILPKDFAGIGVTDNYAAYENRFAKHQKCWAHLLRKSISLMLRFPEKPEYHAFFEALYAIYGEGVRCQKDRRLSANRSERVVRLQDRIRRLCTRTDRSVWKEIPDDQQRFLKLQNELLNCLENLFVFVEHPEVEATNNRSERQARGQAQARKASRTSKTERGAKRRSIIASVLGSLRQCLAEFSIDSVLEEVGRWCSTGVSRFRSQLSNPRASPQPALALS